MLKWMLIKSAAAASICGTLLVGCASAQHRPANSVGSTDQGMASSGARSGAVTTSPIANPKQPAVTAAAQIPADQKVVAALAMTVGGPGGEWIIGASRQNLSPAQGASASKANLNAEQRPAVPGDVAASINADLNHDGFVTLDEIIALKRAGLTEDQMEDRVTHTDQIFAPNERQLQYLRDRGITQSVIDAILHAGQ